MATKKETPELETGTDLVLQLKDLPKPTAQPAVSSYSSEPLLTVYSVRRRKNEEEGKKHYGDSSRTMLSTQDAGKKKEAPTFGSTGNSSRVASCKFVRPITMICTKVWCSYKTANALHL